MRTQPNIIVTGTPGVGKTTHCETLAQNTGLKHLSINDIVKERGCHDGYDQEFKSWIVDEDKVSWLQRAWLPYLIEVSCSIPLKMRWSRADLSSIGTLAIYFRKAGSTSSLYFESIRLCCMIGWKLGLTYLIGTPINWLTVMQRLPWSQAPRKPG